MASTITQSCVNCDKAMKTRNVFLSELTTSSKNYKVKVKVIEKDRPQRAQVSKVLYQSLLLLDDKGNKMRAALFGDQIKTFQDAIIYNGSYEISNAQIKPMEGRYKKDAAELDFQMGFNRRTIIQRTDPETGPALPEYIAIGQIPKAGDPTEKFDVVGVLLFVKGEPRQAAIADGRKINVTELVLMDHSVQQPLTISAWGNLAGTTCETLGSQLDRFKVVGFTAMKVSHHKGFSMSTTMSTEIMLEQAEERVVALEEWVASNTHKLMEIKARLRQSRDVADQRNLITIAALHLKRAHHTLQDDRHWLRINIPEVDFSKLNAFLGCSMCARRSNQPAETTYSCDFCSKDACVSIPRVTYSCDVSDGTGSLNVTAYTENAEKLFRLSAQDIFRMKHSEAENSFAAARELISPTTYLLEVGPKTILSLSNILEWVLKQVLVEPTENLEKPDHEEIAATPLQNNTVAIIQTPSHIQVEATSATEGSKEANIETTFPPIKAHVDIDGENGSPATEVASKVKSYAAINPVASPDTPDRAAKKPRHTNLDADSTSASNAGSGTA